MPWGTDAMGYFWGLCAFALFFLNDYNDWQLSKRVLKGCFPVGGMLLAIGTAMELHWGTAPVTGGLRWLVLAVGAGFLGLLIYTLFFALSVEDAYARPGERRPACTTGVYALCRHPGVLWFGGLYLCLWAAAGLPLWEAALFSVLNIVLVIFEDRCVFPTKLEGYAAYQATTPFLLPSRQSIRACVRAN
jgi:protein-S-isoprenylcysteine O-methyltransferase Ste14